MKEFEKWVGEFNYDKSGRRIYGNLPVKMMQAAWEAALEWVLSMKREDEMAADTFNDTYHIPDWAVDAIEDELEE